MNLSSINSRVDVIDTGAGMAGVIHLDGNTAVIIDSGSSPKQAAALNKLIAKNISAVLHTHTHADHIGGSAFFQSKHSSHIYVPAGELSFVQCNELEGALLYGGCPPPQLRSPFITAPKFHAMPLPQHIAESGIEITSIPTPGHSPAHTSFVVEDVIFTGDALICPEVISKHKMLYVYDPVASELSLDILSKQEFLKAVVSHKGVFEKDQALEYIYVQKEHIKNMHNLVVDSAKRSTAEEICTDIFNILQIRQSVESWYLMLSTIKGYLSAACQAGVITALYENGFVWSKT